jgi:hypothetical protein
MGLSWYQLRNYAALLVLSMTALLLSAAVHADVSATVETQVYDLADDTSAPKIPSSKYFAAARFGPFIVVAANRAELNGTIETNTPAQFRAMLRAYPALNQIDMIDCPGTDDDEANLVIARLIRKAGITTNVPDGGSVRSGGVELFLAGARRHAAPTAEFAVHSWRDEDGLEPEDYAANDAANLEYINFYREIGMDADKAKAFYALTNSVPNDEALYLKPRDIAAYIPLD